MISKLTGENVSEQTLNVLARLRAGETVPNGEIETLPEIQYARACVSNATPTADIAGREKIQENVLNRLQKMGSVVTKSDGTVSFSGEIKHEKRLDIVIGLPAAGKSSAIAEPLSELYKSRIVDSDEAKKILPGYDNGWGAGVVHKESQSISEMQYFKALANGENIVYPRVGGDCNEMKAVISAAKNNGYKVFIHYNELDRNKALGRMLERFLTTGRFLEPNLITKYGDSIDNTYREIKKSGMVDGFSHWNNDVPFGERPKLVEYSGSCRDFCSSNTQKLQAEKSESTLRPAEQYKKERDFLYAKIMEVNEIFKQNPKLAADYRQARDKYRAEKNELSKSSHKPENRSPRR